MRNLCKRAAAMLLALCMTLTLLPPAGAAGLEQTGEETLTVDLSESAAAAEETPAGIIAGEPQNNPEEPVNPEEDFATDPEDILDPPDLEQTDFLEEAAADEGDGGSLPVFAMPPEALEDSEEEDVSLLASEDWRAWAQGDKRWGSLKMGTNAAATVKKYGCLVTSVTKLVIQSGLRKSSNFNVGDMVKGLNKENGFTSSGCLIYAPVSKVVPGFSYKGKLYTKTTGRSSTSQANADQIVKWLKEGYHLIIQVPNHYVAVDEAKTLQTGKIYIMDSAYNKRADLTLGSRYPSYSQVLAFKGGTTPWCLNGHAKWDTVHAGTGKYEASCSRCGAKFDWKATFKQDGESGIYSITPYLRRLSPYEPSHRVSGNFKYGEKIEILVTGWVKNAYGKKWYVTSEGYFIPDKDLDPEDFVRPDERTSSLALSLTTASSLSIRYGGSASILGMAASNYPITSVTATKDGRTYATVKPVNRTSVTLKDTAVNSKLNSGSLSAGNHTIVITAQDISGKTVSKTITLQVQQPEKEQCAQPTITTADIAGGKRVTIKSATAGSVLHYDVSNEDGTGFESKVSTASSVSFDASYSVHVNAYASASGKTDSRKTSALIKVTQLEAPVFQVTVKPEKAQVVLVSKEKATIFYSINGGEFQAYGGAPIELDLSGSVFAYASRNGYRNSETAEQAVQLTAPDAPKLSLVPANRQVAVNTAVMVSWEKQDNAASYTVRLYREGDAAGDDSQGAAEAIPAAGSGASDGVQSEYAGEVGESGSSADSGDYGAIKTQTVTGEANATFILSSAGDYYFTVCAENPFGVSEETVSDTVTAVPPRTVKFIDYDGAILSEQQVDYGSAAQLPPDPERKGYYFQRWDQSCDVVTEDMTIQALYKIITYTVEFRDAGAQLIKSEDVDYDNPANPPESTSLTPPVEGYSFVGWAISAESAGSACDLDHVDSNMTARAVFKWANEDLPVQISEMGATWDGDKLYTVDMRLTGKPEQATTALLRVSLKTGEDKMVKTESRTVQLTGGADAASVSLNYSGTATKAEAVVLGYDGDYLTGSTYSALASCDVTLGGGVAYGPWSEWSTETPPDAAGRQIDTKLQYRYQTKTTTTSPDSSLDGWTKDGEIKDYGAYSSESGWTKTMPVSSETQQVNITATRTVTDQAAYTQYNYYHWWGYNEGEIWNSYGNAYWKNKETVSSKKAFPYYKTYDGKYKCYKYTVSGKHGNYWWLSSTTTVPAKTHTEWKYQTRSVTTTYTYYKWNGNWSDWQDTPVTATDVDVQTRTLYRYRDPGKAEISAANEDKDGSVHTAEGTLPVDAGMDLSGKLATVMVYKGKNTDPNESQIQYVGQTTIDSGNRYNVSFKTREEPTADSGDYVVAMSLEGSTGLINVDLIEAPVPEYTVKFLCDADNTVIKTQTGVREGSNVEMPEAPPVQGYRFVGWNSTGTNIHGMGEIVITAHYIPETYAVAFVDYVNDEVALFTGEHGASLEQLAKLTGTPEAEGYTFRKWDIPAEDKLTGNTVIKAVYEPKQYTVTVYKQDNTVLTTLQVPYGGCAVLPAAPAVEGMTFLGWNTDTTWWDVRSNLSVSPIYTYNQTTQDPKADTNPTEDGDEITLMSTESGAKIYYTLDGEEPDIYSQQYTGPIKLTEGMVLRAIAVAPGKNASSSLDVVFTGSGTEDVEDAQAALQELGTYHVSVREDTKQIPIKVKTEADLGLVGYLFTVECDQSVFYLDYTQDGGYAVNAGAAAQGGVMFCAPYDGVGWRILWFTDGTAAGAGDLFTLTLKVDENAEAGDYPVKISYSPANTVNGADVEAAAGSLGVVLGGAAVRGDVNADGEITTADVILIARYVIDAYGMTGPQLSAADVTGDGKVTTADVVRLARYIVGLAELG